MKKRENGFTLVEILITLSIMAILIIAVAGILGGLPRFYLEVREQDENEEMVWTALNFMARELRSARGFRIDSSTEQIIFRNENNAEINYRQNATLRRLERRAGAGAWQPMIDNIANWQVIYNVADPADPVRFSQITLNLNGEEMTVRPRMFRVEDDGSGWWR